MKSHAAAPRSASRLFAVYAIASLIPVLVLGLVLAGSYRRDANDRGLAEGKAKAALLARTAVVPQLSGRTLRSGLTNRETADLRRMSVAAIGSGQVLRLRIRGIDGNVIFGINSSGLSIAADDEAEDAAHGEVDADITHLNADNNPNGPQGPKVAEVYQPLWAGSPSHVIGVLEVYLPYAPIAQDVDAGLGALYRDLGMGLAVLYLLLAGISYSVTRRLRAQAARNVYLAEHDPLTGLPNRAVFQRRVVDAVSRATDGGSHVTVAVMDLDRFKDVNDTSATPTVTPCSASSGNGWPRQSAATTRSPGLAVTSSALFSPAIGHRRASSRP